MEKKPTLEMNKGLKGRLQAWCQKQETEQDTATALLALPDLDDYDNRSISKVMEYQWKKKWPEKANKKRKVVSPEIMMDAARSGVALGNQSGSFDGDEDRKYSFLSCLAFL